MLWKQDQEIKLKQLNHFSINLVSLTKLVCPDEKVVIDKLSQQNTTSAFQINAPWILNIGEGKTWLLTLWLCFNTLPKIILKNLIWFIASLKKVNNKQLATCKTLYLVFSGNYVKLSDLFFFTFFLHSFVAHNKNWKYQKVWFKISVTMNSKMHFIHMESSQTQISTSKYQILLNFLQAPAEHGFIFSKWVLQKMEQIFVKMKTFYKEIWSLLYFLNSINTGKFWHTNLV